MIDFEEVYLEEDAEEEEDGNDEEDGEPPYPSSSWKVPWTLSQVSILF